MSTLTASPASKPVDRRARRADDVKAINRFLRAKPVPADPRQDALFEMPEVSSAA